MILEPTRETPAYLVSCPPAQRLKLQSAAEKMNSKELARSGISQKYRIRVLFEGKPLEGKQVVLDYVGLPDLVSAKTDA
ncbi:hypothetical protein ABIE78_004954 [Sinorhizobium fredii]|uniref:hypothetical protein n=1 Tax=Rhizobium fredii TaxID=380 RepID=UPI0003177C29|nr:hypothetical protein [Sinorhizobium fredii]